MCCENGHRYKNMGFGEEIDGKYIEYEDMSEDQLMDLFADDYEKEFKYDRDYFSDEYFDDNEEDGSDLA